MLLFMRIALFAIWVLAVASRCMADAYVRQPSIDVLRYEISLEFPEQSDAIIGKTKLFIRITNDGVKGMWLDFEDMIVDNLASNDVNRPFSLAKGRLAFEFERPYSKNEIAEIEVAYHGKPSKAMLFSKNKYGKKVNFTDNWPDHAREWFPSIDHPHDKAETIVSVIAPSHYEVVSNGRLAKTELLSDGRKFTQWIESKPISTYCVAIGIADFNVTQQTPFAETPLIWFSYPQDKIAAEQKFKRTSIALGYFSKLVGAYPYEKLAQVESTTRFGGMENSSAIFYPESSFQKATILEYPVVHEVAHQWFGDSVTPADWDHLWLSEGFATYFDALFDEWTTGAGSMKNVMAQAAKTVKKYRSARSEPIVNPAQTDLMKKLNALAYEKGAWVLHMLRGEVGDAAFFEGIRQYYRLYRDGTAVSDDFQKEMESASGIKLGAFFKQWLYQPGWPEYRCSWRLLESGEMEVTVRQTQNAGLFDMPLEFEAASQDRQKKTRMKARISEAIQTVKFPINFKPASVVIDPDGWVLKDVSRQQR
jgi:aminopeptidase N